MNSDSGSNEDDDYMIVDSDIQEDMNPDYNESPFDPIDMTNIISSGQRRKRITQSIEGSSSK